MSEDSAHQDLIRPYDSAAQRNSNSESNPWIHAKTNVDRLAINVLRLDWCRHQFQILYKLCVEVIAHVERSYAGEGGNDILSHEQQVTSELENDFESIHALIDKILPYTPAKLHAQWRPIATELGTIRARLLAWQGPFYVADHVAWDAARQHDWEEVCSSISSVINASELDAPRVRGRSRGDSGAMEPSPSNILSPGLRNSPPPHESNSHTRNWSYDARASRITSPAIIEEHEFDVNPASSSVPGDTRIRQNNEGSPWMVHTDPLERHMPGLTVANSRHRSPSTSTNMEGPRNRDSGYSTSLSSSSSAIGSSRPGLNNTLQSPRPPLPNPQSTSVRSSSQSSHPPALRQKTSDVAHVLLSRMTNISQLNSKWVGVMQMEQLRALDEHERHLHSLIQDVVNREIGFLEDDTGAVVLSRLRAAASDPDCADIVPSERLDAFIDDIFGGHLELRECHYRFLSSLHAKSKTLAKGGTIARLFLEYTPLLTKVYKEFGEALCQAPRLVIEESEGNPLFRQMLEEYLPSGLSTFRIGLDEYFSKPLEHIKVYPAVLRLARKNTPASSSNRKDLQALDVAIQVVDRLVIDAKLLAWQATLGRDPRHQLNWSDLRSDADVVALPEVERQTAIFDLIQGEMNWVRILALFYTLFVKPLQSKSVLSPQKLDEFSAKVYHIQKRLYDRHFALLRRMQSLQRNQCPVIGVLVKASGIAEFDWIQAYEIEYAADINDAMKWIHDEKSVNSTFANFLSDATFHSESTGQNIYEWLAGPCIYLTRCMTRLRHILDKTPDNHEDAVEIPALIARIERVYDACKHISRPSTSQTELSRISALLYWSRRGSDVDVVIDHPSRRLVHQGKAWVAVTEESEGVEEVQVFLLDNYLLITDSIELKRMSRYDVSRKPVPLELLELRPHSERPRSSTRLYHDPMGGRLIPTPITFHRKDREDELVLLVDSVQQAQIWKQKLKEALSGRLDDVEEKHQLFQLKPIHQFFQGGTCSLPVPFEVPTTLLACSTPHAGIWVLRPRCEPRLLLSITDVTQMGIVGDMLAVLAKKRVTVYSLKDFTGVTANTPRTVMEVKEVEFFRVCNSETKAILVLHRRHGDHFIFELYGESGVVTSSRFRLSPKPKLMKKFGQFAFNMLCHDILFLRARTVLLTSDGFHFTEVDVTSLDGNVRAMPSQSIPFPNDPWRDLVPKCSSTPPLAIIKTSEDVNATFLLCYRTMGVFINRSGKLNGKSLEWLSGAVERVISLPPYILAFSARLMEVRHAATGRLVQTIVAPGIWHMTADGRDGGDSSGNVKLCRVHVVSDVNHQSNERWQVLQELAPLKFS